MCLIEVNLIRQAHIKSTYIRFPHKQIKFIGFEAKKMTLVDVLSKKLKKELLEFGEIESSIFLDTENKGPSKFYKMFYFNFF